MPKLAEFTNEDEKIHPLSSTTQSRLASNTRLTTYAQQQFEKQQQVNVDINYAQSVTGTAQAASVTTAGGATTLVENTNETWINKKWRPMMGWVYMGTCIFDFVLAPIFWSLIQAKAGGTVAVQWQPLTLQGAGLYHVAMGAVIGITAWGRTKEKVENKASLPGSLPGQG